MNNSANNKRIAKNTLMLYIRMALLMLVTLYTSRVILNALGVEDYGIYSVVGGFVTMFAIISNSLSAAVSRFITFELGKGNVSKINDVFCTSVIIQVIIALIVFALSETLGVWFLNTQLDIPSDRLYAANWVFQFSLITFVVNLISVPYNATIIAHEHMSAYAYMSIIDAVLRLLIAFLIMISPIDKLVFYALLMCLASVLMRLIYGLYCKKHFAECKFRWVLKKNLLKEIFGFAGWNFIGAGSGVLRDYGVDVLLNIFCGPLVNAARGISMQVFSAVRVFSSSFTTALNPQITKSFAEGNKEYTFKLVFQGAKLTYWLLYLVSLPIILEAPAILQFWLGVVPEYSVVFVQLVLIYGLTEAISYTMITLMLATGNIRNYQIIVGGCQLLNFPLSYILLKLGVSPEYTFVVSILIALGSLLLRLLMLKRMVGLPVVDFLNRVVLRVILVSLVSLLPPMLLIFYVEPSLLRCLYTASLSAVSVLFFALVIGCSSSERKFILNKAITMLKSKLHKA